jgi:hypothetical protein
VRADDYLDQVDDPAGGALVDGQQQLVDAHAHLPYDDEKKKKTTTRRSTVRLCAGVIWMRERERGVRC